MRLHPVLFAAERLAGLHGRHPGKTAAVDEFLVTHKNVHLHYSPNALVAAGPVENWFLHASSAMSSPAAIFASTKNPYRHLMRSIRHHNRSAALLKWTYSDPTRRLRCDQRVRSWYSKH